MNMAVAIWSTGVLLVLVGATAREAEIYSNFLHLGASFIPIFFCHFVLAFLYRDKQKKNFLIIGYILAFIFGALSFTKYIVAGGAPKSYLPMWLEAGSLYPLLLIYFWFYALAAVYFLLQGYRRSDAVMKRKIFFVLIAAILGFGGGGTNFLPQTVGIYPWGHFLTWLYPIIITYGIFTPLKIKVIRE